MLSLYLYASGAQRQSISVLSTLGLCESYSNLMSKNRRRIRKSKAKTLLSTLEPASDDNPFIDVRPAMADSEATPPMTQTDTIISLPRTGTVYQLSDSMRERARRLAATGLYAETYDNVNLNYKNAEQILGRHGT